MKKLLLAGVAVLSVLGASAAVHGAGLDPCLDDACRFIYNLPKTGYSIEVHDVRGGGGSISAHWELYQLYGRAKSEVKILGDCWSACTLILGAIDKSRLCFGRNALLAFHQARYDSPGNPAAIGATRWMVEKYPSDIQAWIAARGGVEALPERGFWLLSAQDLWKMGYRECTER